MISCFREIETNPNQPKEYLGFWHNESTFVNGIINNEVPKYDFLIVQDGVKLYIGAKTISGKYLNWKVSDSILFLMNSTSYLDSDQNFKILIQPAWSKMVLEKDSITYFLKK